VNLFEETEELGDVLGRNFVTTFAAVKRGVRDLHAGDQPL
jgi:hypothetical protein